MITLTPQDTERMTDALSEALVSMSNGKISETEANGMAKQVIDRIGIDNAIFDHKGPRWLAKEIINHLPNS